MDIDMLRTGKADRVTLITLVKDCATLGVEADGLAFIQDIKERASSWVHVWITSD